MEGKVKGLKGYFVISKENKAVQVDLNHTYDKMNKSRQSINKRDSSVSYKFPRVGNSLASMVSNEESSKIIEEIDPNNPQPISVSVYSQIFEIELMNIDIYNIKSNKFTKFKYPDGSKIKVPIYPIHKIKFISQCLRTKLKMQQNECEQKYYDFDHHVSSLLENKYGYFDKAIEKGLINLKSVIKYSEVDSRFLLPHFSKLVREYEKVRKQVEGANKGTDEEPVVALNAEEGTKKAIKFPSSLPYIISLNILKIFSEICTTMNRLDENTSDPLSLNTLFIQEREINVYVWHQCVKAFQICSDFNPNLHLSDMYIRFKGKLATGKHINIEKIYDLICGKIDLYYEFSKDRSQSKIIKFWHVVKFIHDQFGIEKECYIEHLEKLGVSVSENSLPKDSDKEKLVSFLNGFSYKIAVFAPFSDILIQTIDILNQDYEMGKPDVLKIFKLYSKDDILNYGSLRKYVDDIHLELIQSKSQICKIITDYSNREHKEDINNTQKLSNVINKTIDFEMFYEIYYKYECWKYEDFRREAFKQRKEIIIAKSKKLQIKTKFREPTISSQLRFSVSIPPALLEQRLRLPKESASSKKLQRYSVGEKIKGFKKGTRSMKDLSHEMNKFKITTNEVEAVQFVPPPLDLKKKSSTNLVIPDNPFLKISPLSNVSEDNFDRIDGSVIDEEKTCRDDSVESDDKTYSGKSIKINLNDIRQDLNNIKDEIDMPKSSRNLNKSFNVLNFNDISGFLVNFGRSFVKTHRSTKSSSDEIESSDKSIELNTERLIDKIQDHLQKTNN